MEASLFPSKSVLSSLPLPHASVRSHSPLPEQLLRVPQGFVLKLNADVPGSRVERVYDVVAVEIFQEVLTVVVDSLVRRVGDVLEWIWPDLLVIEGSMRNLLIFVWPARSIMS